MAYLGNTPGAATIIQLEARKSFALGLWIQSPNGKPVDLTGCTLTIVAKTPDDAAVTDNTNLLAANANAIISSPKAGFARFELQASTLNLAPGEYPYAIVLRTREGYSSLIVKGVLDIQANTEFSSTGSMYSGINPTQSLNVLLAEANSINVFVGGQLPPGMNYVRDELLGNIESFDPDAVAMVPTGGVAGYVLTKTANTNYTMAWLPIGNGPFQLDATGQPKNYVPAARGDDTWAWAAVGIDATGVTAGWAPVAQGDGTWRWASVTVPKPDWNAAAGNPAEILNKPTLGTAAAKAVGDFVDSTTLVSAMAGMHFQTTIPTSGIEGHLYFVYTP